MKKSNHLVDILIPTFNNFEMLYPCLQSLLRTGLAAGLYHIYVINNGEKESVDFIQTDHPHITVLQAGKNLGWEGGINYGLRESNAPFVLFCNDDVHFTTANRFWLQQMLSYMGNPNVSSVGPTSNVVMGIQNIFASTQYDALLVKFLIGFCVLHRREALDKVKEGDMWLDETLPGGDDLDWSIRLRNAGYTLMCDRKTFIYHHGFKTGTRVMGGYWNSVEMTEKTHHALIKKHGLRDFWDCLYGSVDNTRLNGEVADSEGNVVRKYVKGKKVLELGVGAQKTVPNATGVDMIEGGKPIDTLEGSVVSVADIVANVEEELPVKKGSFDTVIARHVLEHVVDTVQTLKYWEETLKPGGRIIIAVPDEARMSTIPLNIEHRHAYTQESLRHLMEGLGYTTFAIEDSNNGIGFVGVFEKGLS